MITGFYVTKVPSGAIFECAAAFCILSKANDLQLPWWGMLLLLLVSGAMIGVLRSFFLPKQKSARFLSGMMLDLMGVVLMPLLMPSKLSGILRLPWMIPQGIDVSVLVALVFMAGVYFLLFRSSAGMPIKASFYHQLETEGRLHAPAVFLMAASGMLVALGAGMFGLNGVSGDVYACIGICIRSLGAACLSLLHPIWALPASLLLQYLVSGCQRLMDIPAAAVLPELFSAAVICMYSLRRMLFRQGKEGGMA